MQKWACRLYRVSWNALHLRYWRTLLPAENFINHSEHQLSGDIIITTMFGLELITFALCVLSRLALSLSVQCASKRKSHQPLCLYTIWVGGFCFAAILVPAIWFTDQFCIAKDRVHVTTSNPTSYLTLNPSLASKTSQFYTTTSSITLTENAPSAFHSASICNLMRPNDPSCPASSIIFRISPWNSHQN